MKQRRRPQPFASLPRLSCLCVCYHFLSHSPIRIVQSVLKLTLTEESIPAQCAHASYIYIFFLCQLHVPFASLSHSGVSFFSRPSQHMFARPCYFSRSPGPLHCAIPFITSNYGVSSGVLLVSFSIGSIQSTTLFFSLFPVFFFFSMVVVVSQSVNQSQKLLKNTIIISV